MVLSHCDNDMDEESGLRICEDKKREEQMRNDIKGKAMNISLLRILATLAVVFLHTNSGIIDRPDLFELQENQIPFLVLAKQYMNWAVPVFLMITGALLLKRDKQISFRECMTKYVRRVLLALFCFGMIFSMMEIFLYRRTIDAEMLLEAAMNVIAGESWAHLWYLYVLIGVYCMLPVVKYFADAAPRTELRNILIVMFVFQSVFPAVEVITGLTIAFEIPIAANTLVYLLLGKYLTDGLPKALQNRKLTALYLAAACLLAAGVYWFTADEWLLKPFAPVYAILIFSLFQNIRLPERIIPAIWKLDRLCFGVYLIHPLFINFVYKVFNVTPVSFESYGLMTCVFFLAFTLCSFCASQIMSMVPILKKYIL